MIPRRTSHPVLHAYRLPFAVLLLLLVGHQHVTRSEAAFKEGHLYTDADTPWHYLQKFCFDDSGQSFADAVCDCEHVRTFTIFTGEENCREF